MTSATTRIIRRLTPIIRSSHAYFSTNNHHTTTTGHAAPFNFLPAIFHSRTSNAHVLSPALLAALLGSSIVQISQTEAPPKPPSVDTPPPEEQQLINWSGTHFVQTSRYYEPETLAELSSLVEQAHKTRQKLRPVGSALSPNGLPFQPAGMVSLANLDRIIRIDTSSRRVVVQAGARVNQVVEALRPHGLTLPNFASITEQQVGGLIQVGAHGTGVKFPPIDADVVALKLITPAAGTLSLSIDDDNPSLFLLARVALGLMGVVAEVTLQCVPAHRLVERTVVLSRDEVSRQHADLQRNNRHVRYLWIPYTDDVVVVTCNMEKADDDAEVAQLAAPPLFSNAERLEAARALLKGHPDCKLTSQQIEQLAFTSLRDELLAMAPLDVAWVKRVNEAEAQFWRRSEGLRVDWSDSILQFDCGGQQWVSEVAFPVDDKKPLSDVKYTRKLLDMIEREDIPAPAPIEQRWTAASSSPLSPAGEKPERDLADVYSWVGIIMYLPDVEVDAKNRRLITEAFKKYKGLCEKHLWADARAVEHWAKIEMPGNDVETDLLQFRTREKFPVEALKAVCNIFDPHGILRNDLMDTIFGMKVGKT